jgi:hypothetical protein
LITGERVGTLNHLAEMDRLLRDIQAELLPDREPALTDALLEEVRAASTGAPSTPAPPPSAARTPVSDPQTLVELTTRLLASTRELLAGYEHIVAQSAAPPPVRRRRVARAAPDASDLTLAAGPFASLDALREFEAAVAGLPGVREVAVQAYEGTDRAVIEVRLGNP